MNLSGRSIGYFRIRAMATIRPIVAEHGVHQLATKAYSAPITVGFQAEFSKSFWISLMAASIRDW